jgi:hypothetical protein
LASAEDFKLPLRYLAGLLKASELGAQFVKGDKPFGLLVLVGAALAVYLSQFVEPRLRLALWIVARFVALEFYHRV